MRNLVFGLLPALLVLTGCVMPSRRCCLPRRCYVVAPRPAPTLPPETPEVPEVPEPTGVLYDGRTRRQTDLDAFVAEALGGDLVVFGELHDDPLGAAYEMELLEKLARGARPVAVAMEFFERDTQGAIDAYLAGEMDEETFRKETRRSRNYAKTHGPLVEWAKANGAPVIAANAPRRLVSEYRKGDLDYEGFLASLSEDQRDLLPGRTTVIEDAYWERFSRLMGGERARPFFRSQSLWDDAMAESMATFRGAHPDHQILFVVGAFHVRERLGTITKYLQRRPNDRIALLVMNTGSDGSLAFEDEDHHAADAVLKVHPPKRRRPMGPNPHARRPMPKPEAPQP